MVEVALIEESLSNPRKHFNQDRLQELADSIRASGVHQPILLRPLPGSRVEETSYKPLAPNAAWPLHRSKRDVRPTYELVAGARRLRACKIAEVAEIPAMIRELTDEQALEIQVIENLQREDVTELEEAEGYEVLMRAGKITADEVGAKIGKSRSYVYSRLKILDMCQAGRTAMREGKLDFSKALLVARIPNESQQLKAIKDLTETGWDGELRVGARKAAEFIRDNYMLALDKAPFSRTDADLLPAAGACATCPKRTGANPELFSDVKSADVCTDAPCYRKKEDAHTQQLAEQARARGQTVIAGKEAEELQTMGGYGPVPKLKGYRRLDHSDDSPTDQPLRKIIGKQMKAEGIEPTLIENPRKKGDMIACLPNEVALRLIKAVEAQAKAPEAKNVSKEVRQMAEAKQAKADERAAAQYEQAWRDALLARTWDEVASGDFEFFTLDVHRYLLKQEAARLSTEQAERIAERLDLGKVGAHSAVIDYANITPTPQLMHLLIIMERTSRTEDRGYLDRPANEGLMLVAGVAHLDRLPVVINEVQAEAKAKYLPEPVKPAGPEGTSTPNPAAQATTTRGGKGKGTKGSNGPAAQARATAPKTTKAEATAQIAAGLAALGDQDQAPAAQGNEGAPAPAGGDAVDAAPGNDAGAPAPSIARAKGKALSTSTATDSAAATPGQDSADAKTGAAVSGGVLAVGARVKINATARGPKQALHVGKKGHVLRCINPLVWEVSIPREKRNVPWVVTFHATELEVV